MRREFLRWLGKTLLVALGVLAANVPVLAQNTASLSGMVRDASGAVVPRVVLKLLNANTGVAQTRQSNEAGIYSFTNILPGAYTLEATGDGFKSELRSNITMEVNQSSTIDFVMQVGSVSVQVDVSADAIQLQTSMAELGSVVQTKEVLDLPLNGRNFTELLTLAPGVSAANPLQNARGANGGIGAFVIPAVNGQSNRSNMFLLDGVSNFGASNETYAVQPTIDDVMEFKVQSHNDEARFGQVLGGIVNLVTKSGTNSIHGSLWEFFRNDALDANNYFNPKTALKQNQFGGSLAGPVVLPHYNGRNRTFFYGSYEGFRRISSSSHLYVTPTDAQLAGDFSGIDAQLYNPYSTQFDPGGSYSRIPFMCDAQGSALPTNAEGTQANGTPCNKIPTNLLNSTSLLYAKSLYPAPIDTGVPGYNGRDSANNSVRNDQMQIRIDQQFGEKDRIFFRYTAAWQPDSVSGGIQGNQQLTNIDTYNVGVNWTHTFNSSTVSQFTFGRVNGQRTDANIIPNAPSDFLGNAGYSTAFTTHPLGNLIPTYDVGGYLLENNFTNSNHYADIYEYKSDNSKMIGRHLLRFGGSIATDSNSASTVGEVDVFDQGLTSNGSAQAGGDGMASMLLGYPSYSEWDNGGVYLHGGKIFGGYVSDQWKINDRLTLNIGLRYDVTDWPRAGKASDGSNITGDMDLNNGTYILQNPAPGCSATQGAPCIPGGTLPANVVVASGGKIFHNTYDNIQPRLGLAYRIGEKTVLRAGYGRFYDNWAAVIGFGGNFGQSWPAVAYLEGDNLNTPNTSAPFPITPATDPLGMGSGPLAPGPDPFFQGDGFLDPNLKNPYSDQYNVGIQRQWGSSSVLTVNYVGSQNHREMLQLSGNAATTPGPGDPQLRAPFPYIPPQNGYVRSMGKSNYNALQISSEGRSRMGLIHKIAYTYSKVLNYGCDTYGNFCDVQDPYNFLKDKGVAGFDQTHIFSASVVYELPFGKGKRWGSESRIANALIGGWQVNAILQLSSGLPYDIQAPTDIQNTNNNTGAERANLVGDPYANTTRLNPINVNAFALPDPYTFGNMGRNTLRSDWNRNLDLSFFRSFSFTEKTKLQFRMEAFNVTNTPVFAAPDNDITDSNFGVVSSTANTERQIQLALKLYF